eukprot:jgi/Astpho2/679/Aster-x0950
MSRHWETQKVASAFVLRGKEAAAWMRFSQLQLPRHVGQIILLLPNTMAQTGLLAGVVLQVVCASLALHTLYLLTVLYLEFHQRKKRWRQSLHHGMLMVTLADMYSTKVTLDDMNSTGWTDKVYCIQYHELIMELCGCWAGNISRIVNVMALVGLGVAQVIASSSNLHALNARFSKRDYSLMFGGGALLVSFVPSFRNMRILSMVAILGTTYTSWYMLAFAKANKGTGQATLVAELSTVPQLRQAAAATATILFTYGGHAMLVEVMDTTTRPDKFHWFFLCSYLYTFTLTLPDSVSIYASFPDAAAATVHHMFEKLIRTHDKPMWIRLFSRLPVGFAVVLLAVAFPFFGTINAVLGAITTTLETFIIPALAYNWVYASEAARGGCPKPPILGMWTPTFIFNYVIVFVVAFVGMGLGSWAAIWEFIQNTSDFGVFAECYDC